MAGNEPRRRGGSNSPSRARSHHSEGRHRGEPTEFRASWVIRAAVLSALVVWLSVLVIAAFLGVPGHAFASILFFIAFFVVFVAYYFSMAYVVNEDGLVYRGATDFQHFEWEDILQVDSIDMPLGGYYVTTKQGSFVLSSFVAGHRKLVDMIVTRANLVPT